MSTNHLLKSKITTTLSQQVADKSDNGNRSEIPVPDTTRQTKITGNLSPCFSAFDVAVVGTAGSEIVGCEMNNGLPHSSYTICNIVTEQPIVSPSDRTFVYNTDVATDELTAVPQPKHRIEKGKSSSVSCADQKATCVKVVTDSKKFINADTSNLHLPQLPGSTIVQHDSKPHRQLQPPIIVGPHDQLQPTIIIGSVGTAINPAGDMTKLHDGPEQQTTTERRYKCEHDGCEKSFAYLTHLRFHVQHAHIDYCPYICDFEGCGRCFYTLDNLLDHLRGHTEVKPFICPYEKCKKAFGTTGNLRNHIRTHTGEKPYKCSHKGCSKGFAELSSLRKHELTHTGEKPYPCRICGRCFSQAGSRNTHERQRHKDVFASCDNKT